MVEHLLNVFQVSFHGMMKKVYIYVPEHSSVGTHVGTLLQKSACSNQKTRRVGALLLSGPVMAMLLYLSQLGQKVADPVCSRHLVWVLSDALPT